MSKKTSHKVVLVSLSISAFMLTPVPGFPADYSDLNAFCQLLTDVELTEIEQEVADGTLTREEADEEIEHMPNQEQCACYFASVRDVAGEEYTINMQKIFLGELTFGEIQALDEQGKLTIPGEADEDEVLDAAASACGIEFDSE